MKPHLGKRRGRWYVWRSQGCSKYALCCGHGLDMHTAWKRFKNYTKGE